MTRTSSSEPRAAGRAQLGIPPWPRSVRARVVLLATTATTLLLILVGVAAIVAQQRLLTDRVEQSTRSRVDDVAALYEAGTLPATIGNAAGEGALVQVVRGGAVVASTENVSGEGPVLNSLPAPGEQIARSASDLPVGDGKFIIVARGVRGPAGAASVLVAQSLSPVEDAQATLASILLIALPLVGAAVAAIAWLAVSRALAPIDRARREVEEISASRLDRRLTRSGSGDEVDRLTGTMNALLERIQAGTRRERQFVSDASHELRSPLAAVRSQLEVDLAHPESGRATDTEQAVLADVVRLQQLVENLLVLARSESATMRSTRVDVDDIALRVIETTPASRIEVTYAGLSAGQVDGDPEALERVVRNLLENAVRHARSSVAVSLEEEDRDVRLVIEDDGPGVPIEARERVFERFARVESARDRSSGGAGLGLAITRAIVEGHRGDVELTDSELGGARLVVRLPRARA